MAVSPFTEDKFLRIIAEKESRLLRLEQLFSKGSLPRTILRDEYSVDFYWNNFDHTPVWDASGSIYRTSGRLQYTDLTELEYKQPAKMGDAPRPSYSNWLSTDGGYLVIKLDPSAPWYREPWILKLTTPVRWFGPDATMVLQAHVDHLVGNNGDTICCASHVLTSGGFYRCFEIESQGREYQQDAFLFHFSIVGTSGVAAPLNNNLRVGEIITGEKTTLTISVPQKLSDEHLRARNAYNGPP